MARTPLTPTQRADKVREASGALTAALAAVEAAQSNGSDAQAIAQCWEAVEMCGATVHRQSRILAGKSRGG